MRFSRSRALFASIAVVLALALSACDSAEERVAKHYARGMELLASDSASKAALEFRNALKLNENHAPSRYEIGRLYERDGDISAALGNYRLVAELDPTHLDARIRLTQILTLGGAGDEAERYAAEALALAPDNPDALAAQATVLYRADKKAEALALAEKALKIDPDHLASTIIVISETYAQGDADGALTQLDAALVKRPKELALNLMKLRILEAEDKQEMFGAYLAEVTALYPEEKRFRQTLARWHLAQGDKAAATNDLRALADADPADIPTAMDLIRFISREEGPEAGRVELLARIEAAPTAESAFAMRLALAQFDVANGQREAAIAMLRDLIGGADAPAQRDRARVVLAQLMLQDGDAAGARALVEEVLKGDAQNVDGLMLRASMLIDEYKPADAIRDLRAASDLDSQNVRVMLLLARAHERNGSPDLAGERLAAAARISEFQPDVALAYARFLQGRSQPQAAETVLNESRRRHPDSREVLMALAEQRIRLGDWSGTDEIAMEVARLDGDRTVAREIEAAALGAQGRLDESIELLQQLAEDPDKGQSTMGRLIAAYVRNGEIDKAEAFIDDLLANDAGNVRAMMLRAELYLQRGDRAAAETMVARVIEINPALDIGYSALARLRLMEGRRDDAEVVIRDGIEKTGAASTLRLFLAQLLETRGDFDGAIAQYESLYAQQPNSQVLANNLASLLAEHRADDPASLAQASQVAQRLRGSSVPEFQDTYGWTQYLRGSYEDAASSILPAAQALPQNPWVRFHAGMVFAKLGRTQEAREHLEAALSIAPDFAKAEEARSALAALPTDG